MPASSSPAKRTQVIVVGAGPVGLLAALRLRDQGIDVRIVEQHGEQGTQTFPVVLHPGSLRILGSLGLTEALYWRGRPINQLAIYTEGERRAVLDLPKAAGISPGALTLPQDVLRKALANALAVRGVDVEYGTRLVRLEQSADTVRGWLERAGSGSSLTLATSSAHGVGGFEADYVIGADGYDSRVRTALGIELVEHGSLQSYAFFDALTRRAGVEAQLALSEESSNAVYPVQGGLARFSFQIARSLDEAPDVEALRELIASRLPWYAERIETLEWSAVAEFRHALVERFGVGRVWLAGEAAHLTGPLGVQSLNIGLDEASELGLRIGDALRHPSHAPFGDELDRKRRQQWRQLLGLEERAALGGRSPEWAWRHLGRLMSCLPASGSDLDDLLAQLRLTPSARPAEPDAASLR
ncbi:MAG TPA: NAD(P)/FAD-dependent oxidoreductase [Polyangiaceae bacterium]|nr:NAD(P)/FAD-dependent oxidoreductase [Polyangiaceae bacterium]